MKKPSGCLGCPFYGDGFGFVPAEGDPHKPWNVLESAGEEEEIQERPVMGPAGHEWEEGLRVGCGRRRDQVYITNTIKCRPPKKASPEKWTQAIAHCRQYLEREVLDARIGPPSVVLFGAHALHGWLGTGIGHPDKNGKPQPPSILEWRGSLLRQSEWMAGLYNGPVKLSPSISVPALTFPSNPVIVPTLHPSHIIRGQWPERINMARDISRAFCAFPRRFPLANYNAANPAAGGVSLITPWEIVLDIETERQNSDALTIIGILTAFGVKQYRAIDAYRREIESWLTSHTWKIGQNIQFDIRSLIHNGFTLRGPFWDTISAAKLEEPDLDADLASIASRCLPDYILWKGLPDWPALQRIFREVFKLPEDVDWWMLYNMIDLYQTARIKTVLEKRLSLPAAPGLPSRLDLLYRCYVPMTYRLVAMTEHGMRPIMSKFEATAEKLLDELAQIAAEALDAIEPAWLARCEKEAAFLAELDKLPTCPNHPSYNGVALPGKRKCGQCLQLYIGISSETRERRQRARTWVSKIVSGFNPGSPDHWRWVIYTFLKYPVKDKTETGLPSVDDDVVRLLVIDARNKNEYDKQRILQMRLDYSKKEHTFSSFVEPIITEEALDDRGVLQPSYNTGRTAIGRLSSGESDDEAGK